MSCLGRKYSGKYSCIFSIRASLAFQSANIGRAQNAYLFMCNAVTDNAGMSDVGNDWGSWRKGFKGDGIGSCKEGDEDGK